MSYDVFISHPQEDKAIAERICKAFEKAGITYFCDCQDWDTDFKSHLRRMTNHDTRLFREFLEPAIKESRIILFLANKTTLRKPLFNSLLLKAHSPRKRQNMIGLILTEPAEVSYDAKRFFAQITNGVPEESELINDILFELGRPLVFRKIDPQKYTRQELDVIIKKGDIYYKERKYQKAINCYHIAASCNVAEAKYKLGRITIGHTDYYERRELCFNNSLIGDAADQGYADALYELGISGLNFPEYKETPIWFQRAAEQGHVESQKELAKIYEQGKIVSQNLDIAENWYEKAAIQGDCEAQILLADLYSTDEGGLCDMEKTLFWYLKAAEHGKNKWSIKTFITLGIMFAKGIGCSSDEDEAIRWFSLAVKNHKEIDFALLIEKVYRSKTEDSLDETNTGSASILQKQSKTDELIRWISILVNRGDMATNGILQKHSQADEIIKWIVFLADRGDIDSQFLLGQLYSDDHLPEWRTRCANKGLEKAVYWFEMASRNGHKESQYNMGLVYENGIISNGSVIVKKNERVAARWYRKSAKQGCPAAQFKLGVMYACGKGVMKDDVKAARWYRKAAMNGHGEAQRELAAMYYNGNGVKCNYRESEHWYIEAAKRGLSDVQCDLAASYWLGDFGNDTTKSIRWYRIAADNGNTLAQNSLGVNYRFGIAVVKDTEQAMFWFRKAAESGYALAQRNLAMMIAKGKGSKKKKAEAIEWLRKAAKQGDKVAIKELPKFEHLYGSTAPQNNNS